MNRQSRALLTLLLIAAVGGTGYLIWRDLRAPSTDESRDAPAESTPRRGGTLTATTRSEPRSFNRMLASGVATDLYTHLTQARLVRINRATQEVEPWLAEKWEAAADGKGFTFTLRDGLRWSDGAPFTADDVLFSVEAMYDPRAASILASTLMVDGQPLTATAPDARTVMVTLPAPFGPGVRLLDNLPILPRHKLGEALAAGALGQMWTASTPPAELVGLGPFQLDLYQPGQRLVFKRNPHYWRRAPDGTQLPYLDQLVLEVVTDQNAEILRLQSGEVDMLQQQVRPDDIATLRPLVEQKRLQLLELGVATDPDAFFINLRESHWGRDPRASWITRRELRQAISHAVDREALAESVFLGAAVPIWGPVTPGNREWFSPNVKRYPHSVDTAKQLLASLGLRNRDDDEWLEDEAGAEARLTVLTFRGNRILERELAFLAQSLREVGIALDVVPLETNALVDRMIKADFEAIYFNYTASDLDPAMSKDFWLSSGPAHIWNVGQAKPATPWEAEIDTLMAQQVAALDPAERRRIFNEVQRVFAENLPALYFVAPRLYMGVNARVINLTPAVLRPQLLWSADTIAVRP